MENYVENNDFCESAKLEKDKDGNYKKICKKHFMVVSKPEYIKGNVGEICRSYTTIKEYAFILHDKDKDTDPHYHIYLNFGRASVNLHKVAEWFGIEPQYVQLIKGKKVDALKYLTHSNHSQRNKYQYDKSEVVANWDFDTEIKASDILGDFDNYSYARQLQYILTLPKDEQIKYYTKLEKLYEIHTKKDILENDRQIKVLFFYGVAGVGKTFNAKKVVESLGYDYSISSSSNDPWQDYLGQNAMILDDLRDDTFKFVDLLKILDNHTSSSVKCRFRNKVFRGKCIVITSSIPLSRWYMQDKLSGKLPNESLNQLYRRISAYYEVMEEHIFEYSSLDTYGRPVGKPYVFKNPVKKFKEEEKQKEEFKSFLSGAFERVEEETTIFEMYKINKVF